MLKKLVEKCTSIQITKQLKCEYSFCGNICTPQKYGDRENKRPRKYRQHRQKRPVKRYYLKRSKARKPYLDKSRHVRKFNKDRNYKNTLTCYACKKEGHLARDCDRRHNIHDKCSVLINCVEIRPGKKRQKGKEG